MKTLVIYDSIFGNTKLIAEAIAKEFGNDTAIKSVSETNTQTDLKNIELLIVGCPINGWRPSERMGKFLSSLSKDQLKGSKATTFDTRVKLFIHGDAATKISQKLIESGAELITSPEAFYVQGKQGPLVDGEIERASEWAILIKTKAKSEYLP